MADPADPSASPLGRYSVGRGDGDLHEVHLLGTPLALLVEGRDHHDAVVRELRLLAVSRPADALPLPLTELIEVFGRVYGSPTRRPDDVVDDAIARGERELDLTYVVPAGFAAAARELEERMRQADELCSSGLLITLPRSPRVRAFSEWYLDQICDQVAGAPPRPWSGG